MTITRRNPHPTTPAHDAPTSSARQCAVITCRVCGRRQEVTLANALLLCADCRADPRGLLNRLHAHQQRSDAELDAAWHAFRGGVASVPARDQQRYGVVIGTLTDLLTQRRDDAAFAGRVWRAWVAAGSADDGLARILAAERVLWDAVWRVRTRRIHLARARDECLLALDLLDECERRMR
jgi:hypothetical protein